MFHVVVITPYCYRQRFLKKILLGFGLPVISTHGRLNTSRRLSRHSQVDTRINILIKVNSTQVNTD